QRDPPAFLERAPGQERRRLGADPAGAGRVHRGRRPGRTLLQRPARSEEHTSELQSRVDLVCRLLLEKKNKYKKQPCHEKRSTGRENDWTSKNNGSFLPCSDFEGRDHTIEYVRVVQN